MKQLCSTYSISGSSVTLTGVNVPLSQILLVSDATTGSVLYSMAGPAAMGYTQGANSTIALATAPGSSDKLTVYYDDGVAVTNGPTNVSVSNFPSSTEISNDVGNPIPVSGTVTAGRNWNLATSSDSLTAAVSSLPAVSLASGQNVGISSLPAISGSVSLAGGQTLTAALANGSTLSSAISNFPAVQNVSLVGDGLTAIPASLTAAVSLASGQNVGVSSLPAVSLASGQTLSASIVNGSNTLAVDSLGAATVNTPSTIQYIYTQSGSGVVSAGTVLISTTSCASFRSAGVQIITSGSGASFILKLSLDGGTTFTNQFLNGNVSGSQATSIGINDTTVLFACNLLNATHFQLVQGNAQTAGTSKVIVSLSQQPLTVNNPSVTFPSTSQLTANKPVSANTTAGGSVSTLAGGATVLGGSSATKSLTVQNNNASGNMYFNVGANSTATLPQAQCALLTPGQGFTFDVLPTSTQYLFLQSPTSGLTYSLLYA